MRFGRLQQSFACAVNGLVRHEMNSLELNMGATRKPLGIQRNMGGRALNTSLSVHFIGVYFTLYLVRVPHCLWFGQP